MTRTVLKGHRGLAAVGLLVAGLAVAAATWVSGSVVWAIVALGFYIFFAAMAFLWTGRSSDFAAILRAGADERQRGLDRDATAISGLAMMVFAIVGGIVELARTGNPGVYGLFCAIAGIAYLAGLVALSRRR
jgi:hypothetical protein